MLPHGVIDATPSTVKPCAPLKPNDSQRGLARLRAIHALLVAPRRSIPSDYVPEIERVLTEVGLIGTAAEQK